MTWASKGERLYCRRTDSGGELAQLLVTVRDRSGLRNVRLPRFGGDGTRIPEVFTGDRLLADAEIVSAVCANVTQPAENKRGRFYIEAGFGRSIEEMSPFMAGYVYAGHAVSLGEFVEAGPGGGEGFQTNIVLAEDVAGNVNTNAGLAVTNALRLVRGLGLLYNVSSDVDARTVQLLVRRPLGALPTGFTNVAAQIIWASPTVTLTANEDGMIYAGEGFANVVTNDNGTLAVADNTTAPSPFPFWVTEFETGAQIRTNIGTGNANDRYSVFAIVEEWISA